MLHLNVSIICLKLTLVNIPAHFLSSGKSAHRCLLHVTGPWSLVQFLNPQVTVVICVGSSLQGLWLPRDIRELNALRVLSRAMARWSGFSIAMVTWVDSQYSLSVPSVSQYAVFL